MTMTPGRVLVIGSNSFTGAHLIHYLLSTTSVRVLAMSRRPESDRVFLPYRYTQAPDPDRFRFEPLDVNRDAGRFEALCDAFEPEVVFNYAAQGEVRTSWTRPLDWYQTNCMGVVRVAEALNRKPYLKAYVAASTPEVYGATTGNAPWRECRQYDPSTPYAVSKLAGDLHLAALHRRYGFPVILTRAANLYGIHQQLYRIIPRTILYLRLGRTLELHGRGEARRAFVHARDVADATWRAATRGRAGDVYHIAPDDPPVRIADVVRRVCRLMGCDFDSSVRLRDENFGQDAGYALDASKAREDLGWRPRVSLDDGIAETVEWVNREWETLRETPLDYVHYPSYEPVESENA